MAGNTFGTIFKVTTFGESHGAAIGVVVDGCPAGIPLDSGDFTAAFNTARPSGNFETARREPNIPEILSGVFEGGTLGTPITVLLRNADARPHDYEAVKDIYRPGHADFAYEAKYRRRDWGAKPLHGLLPVLSQRKYWRIVRHRILHSIRCPQVSRSLSKPQQ